jgi:hypothetical protein
MDHLDLFRGSFEDRLKAIKTQRELVIVTACQFLPFNFQEMLHEHEDGEFEYPLEWVNVPDPTGEDKTPKLEVLPLIGIWQGIEAENVDPGISHLTLVGKLPDGDERIIGTINIFGNYTPQLVLNFPARINEQGAAVDWGTADAEIFLNLAESVLQAQNPQS